MSGLDLSNKKSLLTSCRYERDKCEQNRGLFQKSLCILLFPVFIIFCTLLTGCVSQVSQVTQLEQEWLNQDRNSLITVKGTPDQIMDDGFGGQIYTYIEVSSYTTPITSTTRKTGKIYTTSKGWQHSGSRTTSYGGETYTRRTKTMFWLDSSAKIYKVSEAR